MAVHFKVFTVSVLVLLISSTSSHSDFLSNNNSDSAVLENHHHLQLGCVCDSECDRIQEDDCPRGLTLDFCGCCLVCSRGEGEPCGGALGSCAHGLYCVSADASAVVVDQGDSVDDEEGRRCSASPGPILGCNNDKSLTRAERYGCYFSGGDCRCGNFTSCHHHELDYFLFDTEEACRSRIELLTANSGGGVAGGGDVSSGRLLINRERDKAEDHHHGGCSRVKCPEVLDCPSDSYRLPTNIHPESNECCPTVNKCQCNPVLECPKPECPPGWTQQLILNATGEPGRCCPLLECSPSQQKFGGHNVCSYDGIQYNEGDTWTHLEDCTECSCSGDGIVSCKRIKCDLPAQCLLARAPAGSCCPVCAGCTTSRGKVYNNSDVWEEDACTLCECDEGRVKCHATMCQSQCENPIYVPGECCPRCAPPLEWERNDERNCHGDDGMTNCEKSCPFGFAKDNNGCWTCDCNKCPSLALLQCHLDCPLEMDDFGCPICSCRSRTRNSNNNNNTNGRRKSSEWFEKNREKKRANKNRLNKPYRPSFPSVTMVPPTSSSGSNKVNTLVGKGLGKTCHSINGKDEIVRLEGEEWSDGCRQCVCKFEREFCTLISCSPPECEHPIFYPGDCCPRCPDDEDIALEHLNNNNVTICPASGLTNHPHIEGEQWELSPCLKCTCHRGLTLCATPNCPPAPCQAGDLISPDGITSCCPRCKSQPENNNHHHNNNADDKLKMVTPNAASIQARVSEMRSVPLRGTLKVDMTDDMDLPEINNNHKKGKKNCYSDNFQLEYPDGEAWKVGPCQSCICQDGRIECFSSSGNCPRLDCERPALAKNQCCPICLDYGGRVRTEMNCTVSGSNDTWLHGQSWMADKCTRCVCNAPLVQCTRIICSISCRKPLLYVEDECCPICPPDEDEGLHHGGGFLEPYYCNVVIGVLLCLSSLLILYVLSHMYQRRRRRQIRLSDRSSCSFSKPSSTGSSCSSEDSASDYYKKSSGTSCIGKKYPCSSVSRSSSNNSCHGSSESSGVGGGGGNGASAEEKLLCPSNV